MNSKRIEMKPETLKPPMKTNFVEISLASEVLTMTPKVHINKRKIR